MTTCCDTTTTPPPLNAGCLTLKYECVCVADVSQWVLSAAPPPACVPNANCIGQLSCTPLECVIELPNGCVLGDPLPPLPIPWCEPSCCDPPPFIPPDETTTTPPPPTYPPDDPSTTTPPPTYPPDETTGNKCGQIFTALCVDNEWTVYEDSTACVAECEQTDWETQNGDPCQQQMTVCTDSDCKVLLDPCDGVSPPDAPSGTPSCCVTPVFCNCTYISTWNCGTSSWGSPTLAGPCTESENDESSAWAYSSACDALTTVSASGACD